MALGSHLMRCMVSKSALPSADHLKIRSAQEGTHEQTRTILKAQKKCYELGSPIGVRVSGHFEVIVAPCWPQKKVMVETLYIKGNSIYI